MKADHFRDLPFFSPLPPEYDELAGMWFGIGFIFIMKLILIALMLTAITAASAQTRNFRWQDELCSYEGTYNAAKISLSQLKNTLKLARPGSYSLDRNSTVWKFEDIDRLDVAGLDLEFKTKVAELRSLEVAAIPYWQEFKSKKLRELEQVYRRLAALEEQRAA